jgi:hypothetical protein
MRMTTTDPAMTGGLVDGNAAVNIANISTRSGSRSTYRRHLNALCRNAYARAHSVDGHRGAGVQLVPRRTSRRLIALDREVSARELLTHFVELRKPATRRQLRRLAASNPCQPERERLEELAAGTDPCALSPLECLQEFQACALTGAELIELLEPMTPRHYSIASSSRLTPGLVALVVSVLDARPGPAQGCPKACFRAWRPTIWLPSPRARKSGRGSMRPARPSGRAPTPQRT